MTLANDLVQFLMNLFGDRQAAQNFLNDPEKALEDHGLGGVCSADVDAALPVVLDFAPVTVNASRFDREYNTGGNNARTDDNGGGSTGGGNHGGGHHGGGHGGGNHGGDDHAHAVQQLHHVVNNYSYTTTVDDRDTITDQSVNQNIWAEGDVDQYFDNDAVVASGDRAIAAGDDADVEDSNNIRDSYNTDNSSDNSTDNSIRAGEDVNIGNTDIDADDSFNHEVEVDANIRESFNDDHSTNGSYNDDSDKSTNIDIRDSGNDESVKIDDSFQVNDSLNDNSDHSNNSDHSDNVVVSDNTLEYKNVQDNVVVADNTLEYKNVQDNVVVADNEFEYTEMDDVTVIKDNELEIENNTAVAGEDATAG